MNAPILSVWIEVLHCSVAYILGAAMLLISFPSIIYFLEGFSDFVTKFSLKGLSPLAYCGNHITRITILIILVNLLGSAAPRIISIVILAI